MAESRTKSEWLVILYINNLSKCDLLDFPKNKASLQVSSDLLNF